MLRNYREVHHWWKVQDQIDLVNFFFFFFFADLWYQFFDFLGPFCLNLAGAWKVRESWLEHLSFTRTHTLTLAHASTHYCRDRKRRLREPIWHHLEKMKLMWTILNFRQCSSKFVEWNDSVEKKYQLDLTKLITCLKLKLHQAKNAANYLGQG